MASQPAQIPPAQIWYVESRGKDALSNLHAFLNSLRGLPGLLGAELLTSPAQPDLALVASRWSAPPPDMQLPPGARGWTFEVAASCRPGSEVQALQAEPEPAPDRKAASSARREPGT
ncbi:hypothetical protein [Deinococcus malanensis]|nr:hypothetical protein [Deinococcus malanensis]